MAQTLFPIGVPAGEGHVVDREHFMENLSAHLADRVSIVVAAPRRTGKTSVAHETLRRLKEQGLLTAAVDLASATSLEELANKITAACLQSLSPLERARSFVGQGVAELLRSPEIRIRLHDFEVAASFSGWQQKDPWQKLELALSLPETIGARTGKTWVILFDEFQTAAQLGNGNLLQRMRALLQLQTHTAFLFLGSQGGIMRGLFETRSQPFFRYALTLDLPGIADEAWRAYIEARLRTRGVAIEQGALDRLLEATGGHPYDTMEVAYEAYLLAKAARSAITVPIMLGAVDEVSDMLGAVFEAEIAAQGTKARIVLGRVAKGETLYEKGASQSAIRRVLQNLVACGILTRIRTGRYGFTEPLLKQHLLR